MTGILWGVGVGPGDPELITLKAVRILRAAPVLAYLAAEGASSVARTIAAAHLPGGQDEIEIAMPMRVDPEPSRGVYDRAAHTLAAHLAAGRDVVFLCEGDPLFFGSFQYVMERLAGRFEIQVVPGVTSLSAVSARARFALTSRDEGLAVIPATLAEDELLRRLEGVEVAAIVKLGRHLPKVKAVLDRLGLSANAVYGERLGWPGERLSPLAEVDPPAPYFSMVLVRR